MDVCSVKVCFYDVLSVKISQLCTIAKVTVRISLPKSCKNVLHGSRSQPDPNLLIFLIHFKKIELLDDPLMELLLMDQKTKKFYIVL